MDRRVEFLLPLEDGDGLLEQVLLSLLACQSVWVLVLCRQQFAQLNDKHRHMHSLLMNYFQRTLSQFSLCTVSFVNDQLENLLAVHLML